MPKAGAGSTKAIANAIKAKGLGRLRWYCQICEKQCRDENGFQAHCRSEPHMRKMMIVGPQAGQTIAEFSRQFQYDFVTLLKSRHNTQRVRANAVYNEYIQDKDHVHMNATRWVTLTGFIMTLGKAGTVKVDEDDKGFWISWIDDSPDTLRKQAASQKRDRAEMTGEERERKMLEDQITRAREAAEAAEKDHIPAELQKREGEKITLNLFGNAPAPAPPAGETNPDSTAPSTGAEASSTAAAPTSEAGPSKPTFSFGSFSSTSTPTPPVANPLKRPAPMNVFKSAKIPKGDLDGTGGPMKQKPLSEVERLMKEDQARKMNKTAGRGGYQGHGPRRG